MEHKNSRVVVLSLVVGAVGMASPSPSRGDETNAAALGKAELIPQPTLKETGRIGAMFVQGNGVEIQRRGDLSPPKENAVSRASLIDERPLPQPRAGVIDQVVLERQIKARFIDARSCRLEVARRKQLSSAQVTAGRLTLRWTILPSGETAATTVLVTSPADGDLIDCVKRRMSTWTFTRPRGGTFAVQRALRFR